MIPVLVYSLVTPPLVVRTALGKLKSSWKNSGVRGVCPKIKLCIGTKAKYKSRCPWQADRSEYPAEGNVSELCGGVAANSRNCRSIGNGLLTCPNDTTPV